MKKLIDIIDTTGVENILNLKANKMKNLIKIAKASAYNDRGDLYVNPETMELYTTNYWSGEFVKYGSPDKINWRIYDVIEQAICSDFFGYEL